MFIPNELQRALVTEINQGIDLQKEGLGTIAWRTLTDLRPTLRELVRIAKAGLDVKKPTQQKVIDAVRRAKRNVNRATLRRAENYTCIFSLISEESLASEQAQLNLQKLATLCENL